MSFMINNKIIFSSSGGVLGTIYSEMEEIIDIKKITLCAEVQHLIDVLESLNGLFPYFDIAEFVHTSQGMDNFLDIFEDSLERSQTKFTPQVVKELWSYYKHLVKYRDELAAQGN